MNPLDISDGRTVVLLALTCSVLLKFGIEDRVGAKSYFADGSFIAYSQRRYADEGLAARLSTRQYRLWYALKWAGVLLLPWGGWVSVVGAGILAWWFFRIELAYDYKHHTIFLGLLSALVVLMGPRGLLLPALPGTLERTQPEILATICLSLLYLSSAVIKIKSRSFTSGQVLDNLFDYWFVEHSRTQRQEILVPFGVMRWISSFSTVSKRKLFQILSIGAISIELLLVPLLIIPNLWWIAFSLGTLMHLSFTALYAWRLLPFLISCLSIYWMVHPWHLVLF